MLTDNTVRVIRVDMFFKPIIELWSGPAALAEDLEVPAKNVRRWIDSDSIPADWFAAVVRAAQRREFQGVTVDRLAEIAEARRLSKTDASSDHGASA